MMRNPIARCHIHFAVFGTLLISMVSRPMSAEPFSPGANSLFNALESAGCEQARAILQNANGADAAAVASSCSAAPGNSKAACINLKAACKDATLAPTDYCKTVETPRPAIAPPAATPSNLNGWPKSVASALDSCVKDTECDTLFDFKGKYTTPYGKLVDWCQNHDTGDAKIVCDAINAGTDPALKRIAVTGLGDLAKSQTRYDCSGWGLTVPLYSIRRFNHDTTVSGPIKAGLGAGYYQSLSCSASWSWGIEAFGWSEGLDPSGDFQVGAAGGVQLVAFKYFQFGVAVGYDLYRKVLNDDKTVKIKNGLFTGDLLGHPSVSYLLTFTISGSEGK